jgi:hypothetical protein
MLAHFERTEALLDVNPVRRGDVNHVDVRRGIHGLVIVVAVDFRDAPQLTDMPCALGGTADAIHRDAQTLERLNVPMTGPMKPVPMMPARS